VTEKWARWFGDLRSLPHDAALAYRRGGTRDLWRALAHPSLYCLWRSGRVVIIAQALRSFRQVSTPPEIQITRLSKTDWLALESLVTRRELNGFGRRLADGMIGLIAWRRGRPVGYTWIAGRLLPGVTPCPLTLPPTAAYLFDLYVLPGERNSGVGSALVSARLELARDQGFEEGWRMISPSNGASLRTMEKTSGAETRVVAEVRYVKVLAKVSSWYRPSSAYIGSMP
jgi:GNAT superfamily N-acetyltransferase